MLLTAAAIHGAINTFQYIFGQKGKEEAIKDSIKSTGLTTGAVIVGRLSEAICLCLCPPVAPVAALGTTIVSRKVLKDVNKKWFWAEMVAEDTG